MKYKDQNNNWQTTDIVKSQATDGITLIQELATTLGYMPSEILCNEVD